MNKKRIETVPTKKPTNSQMKTKMAITLLEAYGLPYKLTTTGKVMSHYLVQLNDLGYFWVPGCHSWCHRVELLMERLKREEK